MTPSLRELQQAFADAVLDDAPAVLEHVRDGVFPAPRHLQIYRHNTFANLTDALAAVFPVVRRLVGENFFEHAADQFIRRYPPRSGNVHDFGAQFAEFLAGFEPARELGYLPDVARLEWAWHSAFHAGDAPPLSLDALAAVAPAYYGEIAFRLHPSARLVASKYPILRIWQANQPDADGDATVNLDDGGQSLLVIRRGMDVRIELLGHGEYAMLFAFSQQKTLTQTDADTQAIEPQFDLGDCLRRHIAAATITGFTESETADQ